MNYSRLKIWFIASLTIAVIAIVIRSIWQIVVIPTPGTMLIFIPLIIAMLGFEELSREDQRTVSRARRLERYLTQPFFTTEQFTGTRGTMVSLEDSLRGCERILDGDFAEYSERSLYMIGAVEEAEEQT